MTEPIKVFCPWCKQYILDTSPEFVIGGPYNGAMFQTSDTARLNFFDFKAWVGGANLTCPSCEGALVGSDGALLTENGMIIAGQASLDRTFYVSHQEGQFKNQLMRHDIYSKPDPNYKEPAKPVVKYAPVVDSDKKPVGFVKSKNADTADTATRCAGKTAKGTRCNSFPINGTKFCRAHTPKYTRNGDVSEDILADVNAAMDFVSVPSATDAEDKAAMERAKTPEGKAELKATLEAAQKEQADARALLDAGE